MSLYTEQDENVLMEYYQGNIPGTPDQARVYLNNARLYRVDLPAAVYLALQNYACEDDGQRINPKKRDRENGRKRSRIRNGG
jgi:hypothetical protein